MFTAWRCWSPTAYDFDEGVYWQTAAALNTGGSLYRDVFYSQPVLPGVLLGLLGWVTSLFVDLLSLNGIFVARLLLAWTTFVLFATGSLRVLSEVWGQDRTSITPALVFVVVLAAPWIHLTNHTLSFNILASSFVPWMLLICHRLLFDSSNRVHHVLQLGILLAVVVSLKPSMVGIAAMPLIFFVCFCLHNRSKNIVYFLWAYIVCGCAFFLLNIDLLLYGLAQFNGGLWYARYRGIGLDSQGIIHQNGILKFVSDGFLETSYGVAGWQYSVLCALLMGLYMSAVHSCRRSTFLLASIVALVMPQMINPLSWNHHLASSMVFIVLLVCVFLEVGRLHFYLVFTLYLWAHIGLGNSQALWGPLMIGDKQATVPEVLVGLSGRVISDRPFELASRGVQTHPMYVEVSNMRMIARSITCDKLLAEPAEVAGAYFMGGRFGRIDCGSNVFEEKLQNAGFSKVEKDTFIRVSIVGSAQ